jgi:hypothetical protein
MHKDTYIKADSDMKMKLLKPRKPTWVMCAMANACQEELQIEGVDGTQEALAVVEVCARDFVGTCVLS